MQPRFVDGERIVVTLDNVHRPYRFIDDLPTSPAALRDHVVQTAKPLALDPEGRSVPAGPMTAP